MQYRSIKGFTGLSQLGVLFAAVGAGFILAAISQLVIGMQMVPAGTGFDKLGEAILKAGADPANVGKMRLMQIVGTFFLMFVPCMLYLWICHGKKMFWLGFNKRINIWQILLGFAIMFVANLLANPLKEITEMALKHFPSVNANAVALEKQYNDQVTIISNLNNWGEYILSLIIIGFLPAMFEEMLFRGALQNLLNRWWKQAILSIIVSSLLFSLVHMSYFLFFSRAILGFALGWMFWRSKNIWVNIIAHFINNGLVLTVLFYESGKGAKPDIDKMDPAMPLWSAFVSLAILIALCWLFEKVSVKNRIAVELKESVLIKTHDDLYDFPEQKNMV